MQNVTRALFNAYVSQIALLNGVESATTQFTVDPVIEQKLEEVIKQGSEFLQQINVVPVIQQSGDKVGIGVTRTIAGRTDTTGAGRRNPTDPTDSGDKGRYTCRQTNFDYALRYAKLDSWRHKPEFQTLVRNAIAKQQGRDRIMIGWHGESAAATTDRVANPNLEDVNEGWLHKIRTNAPAHVLDDGDLSVAPAKAIYVAPGEVGVDVDYQNLDALVLDAKKMIPEWLRGDTDLVVIVGHDLVDEKYFNIVNAAGDKATEVEAADRILRSEKQLGGLPAVRVPFFPANALLITKLSNLSIYYQEGTRRRFLKDEPEADRIANYESVNEDYVVEDYDITAFVENIVIGKKP
ncbi:phage major capsid protein, P2 family [uncultured Sphingopyxis sp.]|jgi:P2 family phage major capsid protein|uniref:phage major capsid protein, P2 family n=1 Tax=uncultured Sphingopyxis sp. TaxID=310581 RepID=UPI000A844BD3|nr:phage major capsid protein, P2 family [uncultured Sphingopyxis sp.]